MAAEKTILLCPGPIELHEEVLAEAGKQPLNQVGGEYCKVHGTVLGQFQKALFAEKTGHPFIMAGSGSLGFEMTVSNLIQPDDEVLVCHTGFFGDYFANCVNRWGGKATTVEARERGYPVNVADVKEALEKKTEYKMLTITHVDTSLSVKNHIKELAAAAREVNPDILIAVDGVCSFGAEELRFDEWQIDAAFTASQKAFNSPPGLMFLMFSDRAMAKVNPRSFYCDITKWQGVMEKYAAGLPAYFATPAVSLIASQRVAFNHIFEKYGGMDKIFDTIQKSADVLRAELAKLGLKTVAQGDFQANTIVSAYYPDGVDGAAFRKTLFNKGFEVAGGLHKDIKPLYFRIGHMGIAVLEKERQIMPKLVVAIAESLNENGGKVDVPALDDVVKAFA